MVVFIDLVVLKLVGVLNALVFSSALALRTPNEFANTKALENTNEHNALENTSVGVLKRQRCEHQHV